MKGRVVLIDGQEVRRWNLPRGWYVLRVPRLVLLARGATDPTWRVWPSPGRL